MGGIAWWVYLVGDISNWRKVFLGGGRSFFGGIFFVTGRRGGFFYGIMLAVTTILGFEIFGIRIFFGCW